MYEQVASIEKQSKTTPTHTHETEFERTTIKSYSPITGELLGEVNIGSAAEIKQAVQQARRVQEAWALLPIRERGRRVIRFAQALVERSEELVDLVTREAGKPQHEALILDLMPVIDLINYYASHAESILAPREIELRIFKHRKSYVDYRPRGVVGIISPWNFPLNLAFGDAMAALIAGNAVIIKPSEVTPLIAQRIKDVFDTSGLPESLLQVVHGYGDAGAALINAPVDKVVFTGGVSTGRKVAAMCGERLIPCTLELGGKAPLIACADADIERTARAIVYGGFANSGQICVSVERVYAHDKIHDRLLDRVVGLVQELRQGNPIENNSVDIGAITFPKQIEIAEAHIRDALQKGAELCIGGKRKLGAGHFFEPTILAKCNHEMTVMCEEIFGPIVPFMRVHDEEEALQLANDSHLGLNAYVFTRDSHRGHRLAQRVEAGTVMVNDVITAHGMPEAPFGGIKNSGFGRVHGEEGLRDMCLIRHINTDRMPWLTREPIWFPYTPTTLEWLKKTMRVMFSGRSWAERIRELL